jgi:hypothetical protein
MSIIHRILHRPFFIKLLHWEYWSFNTVYFPIGIFYFYFCARARSFFFFSASNPSILNGGFLMESKKAVYDIMPPEFYPRTLYFKTGTPANEVVQQLTAKNFKFPLVGKPDIGARGMGVKKLHNVQEVITYAGASRLDFLIQEFVPYKKEAGIFYYRYPGDESGAISGIVRKEFLCVTGDGVSTIRELCLKDKRSILQLKQLEQTWGTGLDTVLDKGLKKELVPYGNHARGALFLDDTHLVDAALTRSIDRICRQVNGFYFGRLDVRYDNWVDLKQGRNFSIIEMNGAGSEPTHIYDPRHSLFFAWKEIIRHWQILWRISTLNHRKGIPYLTYREGREMLRDNNIWENKLAEQHV